MLITGAIRHNDQDCSVNAACQFDGQSASDLAAKTAYESLNNKQKLISLSFEAKLFV